TRSEEFFATVCSCVIAPTRRTATVISAGHPVPILLGKHSAPVAIEPGPPLGISLVGHPWQPSTIELEPGFALLFYTDGIVEGRAGADTSERFGVDGLLRTLDERRGRLETLLEGAMAAAQRANGGRLPDDVALVLVSERPDEAAAGGDPAPSTMR